MLCESQSPLVSVCMPMYNASEYLRECIDSVLAQSFEDFEFLIVDDGSTDDSVSIVRSYADPRIRLIQNNHDYIGSLNILLDEARGKYIARMDADDVMMPERLQVQYDYMEENTDVDILGGCVVLLNNVENKCTHILNEIWYHEMLEGCCLTHPTVMMRKSSLRRYNLYYREEYIYAEDYALWIDALSHDLKIVNIDKILLQYRVSDGQISQVRSAEQIAASNKVKKRISYLLMAATRNEILSACPIKSKNELTIIIPCYNEGEELGNTIRSIRKTAGYKVDIIVVNDHSNDEYDYKSDIASFAVHYVENKYRIGPAATKEKGVQCCTSEYFIILDAHMRFYQNDWVDILLSALKRHPQSLHCCKTSFLSKENGEVMCMDNSRVTTYGAYIYFGLSENIPAAKWITNPDLEFLNSDYIPCVLGACYATSKTYWSKIRGFEGLLGYGCEEPFISLKAWLEGGRCRLIKNITIGHIYKKRLVDFHMHVEYAYNYLLIGELLLPASLKCRAKAVMMSQNVQMYSKAQMLLHASENVIDTLKSAISQVCHSENWENIIRVNNVLTSDDAKYIELRLNDIKDVLDYCDANNSDNNMWGLYNGKCCMMLLYALLYQKTGENNYLGSVIYTLNEIKTNIDIDKIPLSFKNGLLGIGWTLMYLRELNVLGLTEVRNVLSRIDAICSMLNPDIISDAEMLAEICCYCSARLGFCQRNSIEHGLHPTMLDRLIHRATQIVKSSPTDILDIRKMISLLVMSSYNKTSWYVLKPDIQEIIKLPSFLPQETMYWKPGLMGSAGYLINLLVTNLKFQGV